MKTVSLDMPVLGFVVGTRAALAAGVALLVADRLGARRRRVIGLTLVAVGAATTIPAARSVIRGLKRARSQSPVRVDERLIGVTRYPRKGDDLFD
jgi:hypothetical protein